MRAGCFAETRVINLLNRRFVSFYYNTGGPGLGKDRDAAAFLKGKTKNTYAFYAAFSAAGEPMGITDIYASKDNTFDFLVALLRQNPEFDRNTPEEEAILGRARKEPGQVAAQLEAGRLLEDLGRYRDANSHYRRVVDGTASTTVTADAFRGLLRIARYNRRWIELETLAKEAESRDADGKLMLAADLAMERGFRLKDERKFAELRKLLESAIEKHAQSPRVSELRFYAGVACWFLEDMDSASYHWCWVVENLPDDRLVRRCFTAAAHKGMPYENPELDNYSAPLHGGNIEVINSAYEDARQVYERLKSERVGR